MKKIFFLILYSALSSSFSWAVPLENLRYGEAASKLTLEKLDLAFEAANRLGPVSLPHETKEIRKVILSSREMLDIFAFSFKAGDEYKNLRDTLDIGYESVGHFKDLYDAQDIKDPSQAVYDKTQVEKRLSAVLIWKNNFLSQQKKFRAYVQDTLKKGSAKHKKKHLSNQFWRVSDFKPQSEDSALMILKFLLKDIWSASGEEYKIVKQITDPALDHERIEVYHDFRKRIRSALKIVSYFDELAPLYSESNKEALAELVDEYGNISDLIIQLELAENEPAQAEEVHNQIKQEWKSIQSWEAKQNIDLLLKEMSQAS